MSYEDREDLLEYKSDQITTHYTASAVVTLNEVTESVYRRRLAAGP